jgi:hypothetical protein
MASPRENRNELTITKLGESRWSATIVSPEGSVTVESDSIEDLVEYASVARLLLGPAAISL